MKERPDRERPLDAWETREFEQIMEGFFRTARRRHRRVTAPVPSPVSSRQVLVVLTVAVVLALAISRLPDPFHLWGPVILLAVIMAGCVVWGLRSERSGTG